MSRSAGSARIVVAGGGTAGLEAALALGELLEAWRRRLSLIAPDPAFAYRPLSSVAEFATHPLHELPLAELAASVGAQLVHDRVALVDEGRRRLLTGEGSWVGFDYLLLAVGARQLPTPHGWLRWPKGGDPGLLRTLLEDLREGRPRTLAVVVPAYSGWPLAGFELALILSAAGRATSPGTRITLLTEDERPLRLLGAEVEALVGTALRDAGVERIGGTPIREAAPAKPGTTDWLTGLIGRLRGPGRESSPSSRGLEVTVGDQTMSFDQVVSMPTMRGPAIGGLPAADRGFLAIDDRCQVFGAERIWAAGDCTAFALRHSSLAAAQADAAAAALAAELRGDGEPPALSVDLTGILVSGAAERWWAESSDLPPGLDPATHCLWWPPGRVLGGRLAHYLAKREPGARPHLLAHPAGTAVRIRLPRAAPRPEARGGDRLPADEALLADAFERQVFALHRAERVAESRFRQLQGGIEEQSERSRQVLGRLNAAGYLVKDPPTGAG